MDDAARVGLGHRGAGLENDVDRFPRGQPPAGLELVGEVVALEEFHHHVRAPFRVMVDVGDPDRVAALQPAGGAGLALEAGGDVREGLDARLEHLDRRALLEAGVHHLVDDPHPPFADDADDVVLVRDAVAGRREAARNDRALVHRTRIHRRDEPLRSSRRCRRVVLPPTVPARTR